MNLPFYGHNLFLKKAALFPLAQLPVSDSYIIGPGDEIKVLLWGRINETYSLLVDREGNILFPGIGPISVVGLTFKELKELIKRKAEGIVGVHIAVTMGRLRSIRVFVLGEVRNPGIHSIGALSTAFNAIAVAGGPTPLGSLRACEIKRDGRTIAKIDFYDFLTKGTVKRDIRLKSGDVVFVPRAKKIVAVIGPGIKRPGIYELKDKETLSDLIELAGGLSPIAYKRKIQIRRVYMGRARIVLDLPYKELKEKRVTLKEGDIVTIFPIINEDINKIVLLGNVVRGGEFQWKPGIRVSDIVKPNILMPDTFFSYALIKRRIPPDYHTELIPFNLGAAILSHDKKEDKILKPLDEIYIFSRWMFYERPSVSVQGEVRKPGKYRIESNSTLRDVILLAGGLKKDAYLEKAEIIRIGKDRKPYRIYVNLKKALSEEKSCNLLLKDDDKIVVHSIYEFLPKKFVSVHGMVTKPGKYTFTQNMRIKDLIFCAGNIKEGAYLDEAELFRYEIVEGKMVKTRILKINLRDALLGGKNNILLKPYDDLHVKAIPKWLYTKTVTVSGEFVFPGKYKVREGEKLSSLIKRAGGFTKDAYLRGFVFRRESVRLKQENTLRH